MFRVVIGKEIFGGTGRNFLNPALTARAFLYFAYAGQISGDRVWTAARYVNDGQVDGYSGATALGQLGQLEDGRYGQTYSTPEYGHRFAAVHQYHGW